MLTLPVILQRVQAISGRNFEIVKFLGQIHVFQFPGGSRCDVSRKALGFPVKEQVASTAISKGLDHDTM
jgi:hypothetical protein